MFLCVIVVDTCAATGQQPFHGHYMGNLCYMAPPVNNWRILLEQNFLCWHAIPLLMAHSD